jgi:hypothetical protein
MAIDRRLMVIEWFLFHREAITHIMQHGSRITHGKNIRVGVPPNPPEVTDGAAINHVPGVAIVV